MRIMVVGDLHGQLSAARTIMSRASMEQADVVLQVGDWGFAWPGASQVGQLRKILHRYDIPMYFIDGNHDDYGYLRSKGFLEPHAGIGRLGDKLSYIPRGWVWGLEDIRFLAMGGGVSIDRDQRVEGVSWWPEEQITHADTIRAADNVRQYGWGDPPRVDVMVCHDAPEGIATLESALVSIKMDDESRAHRRQVRRVADMARPAVILHGHYHYPYVSFLEGEGYRAKVIGLNCDGLDGSWEVLDTDELRETRHATIPSGLS